MQAQRSIEGGHDPCQVTRIAREDHSLAHQVGAAVGAAGHVPANYGAPVSETLEPPPPDVGVSEADAAGADAAEAAAAEAAAAEAAAAVEPLEQALEFCREDECVEVTPATVRLRKVVLPAADREKSRGRRARAGLAGGG